jgi:hypothetical protein
LDNNKPAKSLAVEGKHLDMIRRRWARFLERETDGHVKCLS